MTRRIIQIGLPVVLVAAVAGVSVWALSINRGTVTPTPDRSADTPTIKHLAGSYLSFNYSSIYSVDPAHLGTNELEAYNLTTATSYEKHVAIAVTRLTVPLDQDTDYSSRKTHPELYTQQSLITPAGTAVEFIRQDGTERTVFLTHGTMVASLAFVSMSKLDDVQSEITTMLDTVQWEQ